MNRQHLSFLLFCSISMTIGFTSCKKEAANTELTGAQNEVLSQFIDKAMTEDIDAATLHRGQSGANPCNWQDLLPDCAEVTESGDDYPKEIVIDYGDGCVDNFGRVKSGQVVINISDDMMNEGAQRVVSFVDFQINNVSVDGVRTTTNIGEDSEGHPMFGKDHNMVFVKNGNTLSREHSGQITWLSGYDTEICGDNVFMIEGSGQCIRPNGVTVSRTILEPIIVDYQCAYISQGVVQVLAPPGERIVDFGDGTCDDIAVVTANGESWEIDLDP